MRTNYQIVNNKLVACSETEAKIIVCTSPDKDTTKSLIETYDIDEHTLNSALDPDEVSRFEFEPDHSVVIIKSPKNYSKGDNLIFKVTSIGMFMFKDRLLFVIPEEIEIFEGRQPLKLFTLKDVMLKVLYGTISHFLGHLRVIDMISESLEDKINESMENKFLINMFKIQKSLVYYINGINSNAMLFDKLKLNAAKIGFLPEDVEFLEDIIIENNQCSKQANIYSNIITGLMETRGSIVNNNLNMLIKRLTILSVVFMPLNVIAGVGGMSEFSLLTGGIDWRISYSLLGLFMIGVSVGTYFLLRWVLERKV